jgi:hypothetical protein
VSLRGDVAVEMVDSAKGFTDSTSEGMMWVRHAHKETPEGGSRGDSWSRFVRTPEDTHIMAENNGEVKIGDRLPPQNLEAERATLGSMLLDNDILKQIISILNPAEFYSEHHRVIYRAIVNLNASGKSVDAITLADELIANDQFKKVGGDEILKEIIDSVNHAANGKYYAGIVKARSEERREALIRRIEATVHDERETLASGLLEFLAKSAGKQMAWDESDLVSAGLNLEAIGLLERRGLVTWEVTFTVQLTRVDYDRYIVSPEWREKAEAAKERAGHRCQVCNISRDQSILDAHHRTYDRLGCEEPGDITVLCRECHRIFHENGRLAR